VVHRDLKLSNVLLNKRGEVKLADFGLAKQTSEKGFRQMTPKLTTLWYRAPEILLRCPEYGLPADMWALGCILAELLNEGMPLMPGQNEID
jgi:serine/threonine protein kinase